MGPYVTSEPWAEHRTHLWPWRNNLEAPPPPPPLYVYRVVHWARKRPGFMFGNRGDDRSSAALRSSGGGGFSSAVEPRGWTAPQPRLISSFSTPVQTDLVQHSLSCEHERVFSVSHGGIFPASLRRRCERFVCSSQGQFHITRLFFVSAAAAAVAAACSHSDTTAKLTYCHAEFAALTRVPQ